MNQLAYNATTHVADDLWSITGFAHEMMYLVVGSQKAMLVDTGMGIGDLDAVVRKITRLPVFVVNTHGHPDHAGGNPLFKHIWLHPSDRPILRRMCTDSYRSADINAADGMDEAQRQHAISEMVHYRPVQTRMIRQGQVFDLGGRNFEVIETPGHTPGSVCLLNSREKLLITGDTVVETPVWLYLPHSMPLEIYRQSLDRLWERRNEFKILLPGHPSVPLGKNHLRDLITCAGEILERPGIGEKTTTFAGVGTLWRSGRASIIYQPDRVQSNE